MDRDLGFLVDILVLIGEASRRLSEEFRAQHPEIPGSPLLGRLALPLDKVLNLRSEAAILASSVFALAVKPGPGGQIRILS